MRTHRTALAALAVVASLVVTAQLSSAAPAAPASSAAPASAASYDKVMVIAEENEADSSVIGSAKAPYLNSLARTYGEATNMQAGYPTACPSLAAYLLITSGDRDNICDDKPPASHHLSGNNIFNQVAASGLQWREYAESMPGNCSAANSENNVYLVRHAPPPYYTTEAKRCQSWDVPLGTTTAGTLHNDLSTGLAAYSFVTPNACDDMHGAPSCSGGLVAKGDSWLAAWMPKIIASKDFQSSRLLVVITWDEGTKESNHIATLVVGASIHAQKSGMLLTHCSTLRTTEDILGLAHLGCAGTAASFRTAFAM
jgi:hypothetical protein